MKRLLIFGRFTHDPQSVLATVYGLALVGVELGLNVLALELGIAPLTDAKGRRVRLYESQFALCHDPSLAHVAGEA
ncbi:MAG: hypothetical protein ABSD75_08500 [Terriglobales bacterium]|jgi:hypothetical protein